MQVRTYPVTLSEDDKRRAWELGKARHAFARGAGLGHAAGVDGGPLGDALGAAAELAVSKLTGLPWDDRVGVQPKGTPDVGPLHVRHTRHDGGHLLLTYADPDPDPFVLVTGMLEKGKPPTLVVRGYIRAGAGKLSRWWRKIGAGAVCFCIPQAELRDLGELRDSLRLWRDLHAWDGQPVADHDREVAVLPAAARDRRLRA